METHLFSAIEEYEFAIDLQKSIIDSGGETRNFDVADFERVIEMSQRTMSIFCGAVIEIQAFFEE